MWPSAMQQIISSGHSGQQIISQPVQVGMNTTHLTTHQSILPKPEIEPAEQV